MRLRLHDAIFSAILRALLDASRSTLRSRARAIFAPAASVLLLGAVVGSAFKRGLPLAVSSFLVLVAFIAVEFGFIAIDAARTFRCLNGFYAAAVPVPRFVTAAKPTLIFAVLAFKLTGVSVARLHSLVGAIFSPAFKLPPPVGFLRTFRPSGPAIDEMLCTPEKRV